MAYRFETDESAQAGFHRNAAEQLDRAIKRLTHHVNDDPVSAIHDARKSIKKERSLLRLVAPAIRKRERRDLNTALRTTAHELGAAREADALLSSLASLAERYAGQVPQPTFDALRVALETDRDAARQSLLEAGLVKRVAKRLRRIRDRTEDVQLGRSSWSAVDKGLTRSYRRGRRAMARAAAQPGPVTMHEWRKRAKDHWYQLRLLKCTSPGTVGGAAEDAHRLADVLGDVHDLAELDAGVRTRRHKLAADLDPVLALIEHYQAQLRGEAFGIGARVYAEKPKAFRRRMKRYWKAWRASARAANEAQDPRLLAEATRHPVPV